MIIVKHPLHGCRHVSPEEVAELVSAGWTRFPRSRAEKAAGPWPPPAPKRVAPDQDVDGDAGFPNEPTCTESQTPDSAPEIPVFTAPRAPRKAPRA